MSSKTTEYLKYIKKLDKFGKKASLYYEGHNKRALSWIGFFFTFIYYFSYLYLFINKLIISIFKKSDVVVYDTFAYVEEPPSVNLTSDNFYVGFALENPETYDSFIDEAVYYSKAYFKEGERIEGKWNWKQRELDLEKCKLEKSGKSFQDKFKANALDSLYCFKNINETSELLILFI